MGALEDLRPAFPIGTLEGQSVRATSNNTLEGEHASRTRARQSPFPMFRSLKKAQMRLPSQNCLLDEQWRPP